MFYCILKHIKLKYICFFLFLCLQEESIFNQIDEKILLGVIPSEYNIQTVIIFITDL